MKRLSTAIAAVIVLCSTATAAVPYRIGAVRARRDDPAVHGALPEAFTPLAQPAGDLVAIEPAGAITTLVSGNGGAFQKPRASLDGQWLYYSMIPDNWDREEQRGQGVGHPRKGSDIYRVHLTSGKIVRVTGQNWTPPGGVGKWAENPSLLPQDSSPGAPLGMGYGVVNINPCPIPGGKLVFVSNRRGYIGPKGAYSDPQFQLFILDDVPSVDDYDGEARRNVECTGHWNVGSALDPTLLKDGRIALSSQENQGLRDPRQWGIFHCLPDGSRMGPIYSAFLYQTVLRPPYQRTDGSLGTGAYYNFNNNGFGTLFESPLNPGLPEFLSPDPDKNPQVQSGFHWLGNIPKMISWSTMRRGTFSATPWAPHEDLQSLKVENDQIVTLGKVAHPTGAPDNALLVTYSPGRVNLKDPPHESAHCKVGIIRGKVAETPQDIEILAESDDWHFMYPTPLLPWKDIYGEEPIQQPIFVNPSSTPFATFEFSSSRKGQWKSGTGNWPAVQGFWTGHPEEEPAGMDIVAFEPMLATAYWNQGKDTGWQVPVANERCRILARVLFDEPDRPKGDTSVRIKVPANVPLAQRVFGSDGRTITFSQTWLALTCGEVAQCGGCHNHSDLAIYFEGTYASLATTKPRDFRETTLHTPEFWGDVYPVLARACFSCHGEEAEIKLTHPSHVKAHVSPGMSYQSQLSTVAHSTHHGVTLPAGDRRAIDDWIDYFCLESEDGRADFRAGFADLTPPTLFVPRGEGSTLKIGAYDYFSKLKSEPRVKVNGAAMPASLTGDQVWTVAHAPKVGDLIEVEAEDQAGNVTRVERAVKVEPKPPPTPLPTPNPTPTPVPTPTPEPSKEVAELRAAIEKLKAEVVELMGYKVKIEAIREVVK